MATLWQTVAKYWQTVMSPADIALNRRGMSGPLTWTELASMLNGGATASGTYVSETTALNLSAVWCAVKNIAGTVGTLPLILYRRVGEDGRERFQDHALYRVLHDQPHPDMTASTFWTTLESHVLLWGNGYAEILRDGGGRVRALALLTPDRVRPRRDERTQALYYEVTNPSRPATRLRPEEILHVKGLSHDGTVGYSVIARARQGLGISMATELFGAQLFGKGPQWSGILQHPKTMRPETRQALRADLKGLAPGDWPMLEEGIEWKQIGMPADDAQFLETRMFQVVEVARWFNIPPHKLKDLERATFSNIEEQGLDYLTDTIRPELVNIAQEVNTKLIAPAERRIQYAEHLVDALLRGRAIDRATVYDMGLKNGTLSLNEARARENMNAIPGGDKHFVPLNMVPLDRVDEVIDAQTAPKPAPAPPAREPESDDDRAAKTAAFLQEFREKILAAIPEPAPRVDYAEIIRVVVEDLRVEVVKAIPPPAEPLALPDVGAFAEGLREEIVKAFPPIVGEPDLPTPAASDDEPDTRRHARIVASHRLVVSEAVRRMFVRERERAKAATKSPERMRAWVGEFYERHGEALRGALTPGIGAHCAYMGGDRDADVVVRELVDSWCEESKRQIHALLDRQPADLPAEVEAMLTRWEAERLHGIPDAIMQEEMIGHG